MHVCSAMIIIPINHPEDYGDLQKDIDAISEYSYKYLLSNSEPIEMLLQITSPNTKGAVTDNNNYIINK